MYAYHREPKLNIHPANRYDRFPGSVGTTCIDVRNPFALFSDLAASSGTHHLSYRIYDFLEPTFEASMPRPVGIESLPHISAGFSCRVYKRSAPGGCGDGSLGSPYDVVRRKSDANGVVRIPYPIPGVLADEVIVEIVGAQAKQPVPQKLKLLLKMKSEAWDSTAQFAEEELFDYSGEGQEIFLHELHRNGAGSISGSSCYHTVHRVDCKFGE